MYAVTLTTPYEQTEIFIQIQFFINNNNNPSIANGFQRMESYIFGDMLKKSTNNK